MYQPDRLHRSRLVRLLQHWAPPRGAEPRLDVAEQLSQWLSTVDAVQLGRALHALEAPLPRTAATAQGSGFDVAALARTIARGQDELAALLTPNAAVPKARAGRARADNTIADGPDLAAEGEFAVHAARYQALQKQVESRVAAMRAQARRLLAQGTADLRQLALLDAVMEQVLGAREQRLLASLLTHLEKRMADLRAAHLQRLQAAGEADAPERWRAPGGWLFVFEQDVRTLMQCEIELRMQPLHGLLEAARGCGRAPRTASARPVHPNGAHAAAVGAEPAHDIKPLQEIEQE